MDIRGGFRIGPWGVSPLTGEIESAGKTVHLEPKVMEVLVALAEKAESVVLREELLEKVWGARAAVSDEPLTRCITQLRQALGDSSRNPDFVQTIPKRGYRLMVPALPPSAADESPQTADSDDGSRNPAGNGILRSPWLQMGAVVAVATLALAAYQTLPLILDNEDFATVDPCRIEERSDQLTRVDDPEARAQAIRLCEDGDTFMRRRTADNLIQAMHLFREAIKIDDSYGSAIVQLARAMVLLPTYAEFVDPADCSYDQAEDDPFDCYEGAFELLERNWVKVPYIDPYIWGIRGYVATKQRRWSAAALYFSQAESANRSDADMWQWLTQFRASVADLHGAMDAIEEAYDLKSDDGVIRERYGVLAMWLNDDAKAREMFDLAGQLNHNHYEAAWLVLNIRLREWDEVRESLENHALIARNEAPWIDVFIEALKDPARVGDAVHAVRAAIDAKQLRGQYGYGAWVFLKQDELAIDAALDLIRSGADMDVEFLFAPETKFMRQNARFGEIVDELGLEDYWREGNCPSLFTQDGENDWCD